VYNYSSGTTNLISRIVADHVGYGEPYRSYLHDRLFTPLGMNSATATFDDAGVFIGSSYVYATARDFAKFGYLYLRGGEWDGHQLVSQSWAATAQDAHSFDDEMQLGYAWQWWVRHDDVGTYAAQGFEGQRIVVVPELDAVIVRCGKTPAEQGPHLQAWLDQLIRELA
jgi:CubicO group peptidase (beta-lactamase class C family)